MAAAAIAGASGVSTVVSGLGVGTVAGLVGESIDRSSVLFLFITLQKAAMPSLVTGLKSIGFKVWAAGTVVF